MIARKLALLSLLVWIVGCSNTGPQPIGKDTYLISARVPFTGESGAKAEALTSANANCATMGKKMLLGNISSNECALRGGCGEAQVIYYCLAEGDPRFNSPAMRKEADTVIRMEAR